MGQLGKSLMVLWSEQVKPFSHKQIVQPQIFIIPSHFPWWIVSLIQKIKPLLVIYLTLLPSSHHLWWALGHFSNRTGPASGFFIIRPPPQMIASPSSSPKVTKVNPTGSDLISSFVKLWRSLTLCGEICGNAHSFVNGSACHL